MTPQRLQDLLEDLVDKSSLSKVLQELAEICYLKAEHMRDDRQDPIAARVWWDMAEKLYWFIEKIPNGL